MRVVRRVLAGLGLLAFLYAVWLFRFWFQTPAGPHLASVNGLSSVEECSEPSSEDWPTCVQLACESEAHNRRLVPMAERRIVSYIHSGENTKEASVVAVKHEIGPNVWVVQCRLEGLHVVSAKPATTKEFDDLGVR